MCLPISPICFIAGTPVNTDQGKIPIDKINPLIHTIRTFTIKAITKTISSVNWLVCIEPNGLGKSIPSIRTIISPNHKVFDPQTKSMIEVRFLIKDEQNYKLIYPITYSGEVLYNVLLSTHEKMIVNNMIVETLDPTNVVAQLYSKKNSQTKHDYLIKTFNNCIKTK